MFGFLRRKKKKKDKDELKESLNKALTKEEKEKNLKKTLDDELKKEKKRKKKPKGPNWPAFIVLLLSFSVGIFFFIYGRIERLGLQGLIPDFSSQLDQPQSDTESTEEPVLERRKLPTNEDGLIIFEKKE